MSICGDANEQWTEEITRETNFLLQLRNRETSRNTIGQDSLRKASSRDFAVLPFILKYHTAMTTRTVVTLGGKTYNRSDTLARAVKDILFKYADFPFPLYINSNLFQHLRSVLPFLAFFFVVSWSCERLQITILKL